MDGGLARMGAGTRRRVSVKAAQVQDEIDRVQGQASPLLRTRLAAVDQQKLERYQQRYEEYIKTAKALAAFAE